MSFVRYALSLTIWCHDSVVYDCFLKSETKVTCIHALIVVQLRHERLLSRVRVYVSSGPLVMWVYDAIIVGLTHTHRPGIKCPRVEF